MQQPTVCDTLDLKLASCRVSKNFFFQNPLWGQVGASQAESELLLAETRSADMLELELAQELDFGGISTSQVGKTPLALQSLKVCFGVNSPCIFCLTIMAKYNLACPAAPLTR